MTPEAQRIAMAEACGFRKVSEIFSDWDKKRKWATPRNYFWPPDSDYGNKLHPNQMWGWQEPASWASNEPDWGGVPDYLTDLNAMHEAESYFPSEHHQNVYGDEIRFVMNLGREWRIWRATAAQRAEAFLRTIGKWDDSK